MSEPCCRAVCRLGEVAGHEPQPMPLVWQKAVVSISLRESLADFARPVPRIPDGPPAPGRLVQMASAMLRPTMHRQAMEPTWSPALHRRRKGEPVPQSWLCIASAIPSRPRPMLSQSRRARVRRAVYCRRCKRCPKDRAARRFLHIPSPVPALFWRRRSNSLFGWLRASRPLHLEKHGDCCVHTQSRNDKWSLSSTRTFFISCQLSAPTLPGRITSQPKLFDTMTRTLSAPA